MGGGGWRKKECEKNLLLRTQHLLSVCMYYFLDHGPHFASNASHAYMSTLHERFNKVIVLLYLTSYHCFNVCDGKSSPLINCS